MTARASSLPVLALLAGSIALALGTWLVRLADSEGGVGPVASALWRLSLAVPALWLLTRATGQRTPRPSRAQIALLAAAGLFFAFDLGFWHIGILETRLANATLLGNAASLFFPLYGFVAARTLPTRGQIAALLIALVGIALLLGRSVELSRAHLIGDLLCLLAGLFYTAYLIVIDRLRADWRPMPTLLVSTAAGVLPLLLMAAALGETIWPRDWTPLIMLALGSQVFGQGMLIYAVGRASPLVVGLMLLIQPVVTATVGFLFYDERLVAMDFIGAAAVIAAIIMVARPRPAA